VRKFPRESAHDFRGLIGSLVVAVPADYTRYL
jgi:hypothetical protein